MTPDAKNNQPIRQTNQTPVTTKTEEEDSFFDLLSRFQSKRMDDQRCSLTVDNNKENTNLVNLPQKDEPDDLMDMIAGMQSKRMDEQRVELPHLPGNSEIDQRIFAVLFNRKIRKLFKPTSHMFLNIFKNKAMIFAVVLSSRALYMF